MFDKNIIQRLIKVFSNVDTSVIQRLTQVFFNVWQRYELTFDKGSANVGKQSGKIVSQL